MRLLHLLATLSLWLSFSTAYVTPSRANSNISSELLERGTSCGVVQILSLEAQLLKIVKEVECYLSTKITLPGVLGLLNNIFSIGCSSSDQAATVAALQKQAVPIWSSIEHCIGVTMSMPTLLQPASATTSQVISSTKVVTTSASTIKSSAGNIISSTSSSKASVVINTSATSLITSQSTSLAAVSSSSMTSSTTFSSSVSLYSLTSSQTSSSVLATGTPCAGNTASDRSVWCDYSTATDYYEEVPNTGVTREYWLDITATTAAPDGFSRYVQLVNGSLPGPTLFADWGDTVVVHVTNNVPNNGSSIHFHGIRQNYTNQNDGVPSLTQCPIAPGETYTYTWRATQYGTSWYHSHFALQAWEGVFGGIVINGPATSNYDTDGGILFLNDWSHQTSDELYTYAQTTGPPPLSNALINGTNVFGEDGNVTQTGKRFEMNVVSGQSTRLRLVNGAIDTHFKFSVDNHTLTVMSTDFVPIVPYTTDVLNIAIGQRYDVILTANQGAVASDFWMRAIPQLACSDNDSVDNIKGIVHYGSSTSSPITTGYAYDDECVDEALTSLVPYVSRNVNSGDISTSEAVTVAKNTENLFRWYMNGTAFDVDWANPTLLQVHNNITTWAAQDAVIEIPKAEEWLYIVVETQIPVPHPIHLHGHDFFIVAQGSATYDPTTVVLNRLNPPRRDVALLPASGYVVLAFEADNPGAWLMHCHIGWHTSEGFSLQFIERYDEIDALLDVNKLEDTCSAWSSGAAAANIVQDDSGV